MLGPMMSAPTMPRPRGFTITELLVVVAVTGVLITLAAPSLRDFILLQRLKGVNEQLVTDLAFARSEAVARNQFARLSFRFNAAMTCYTIYTSPANSTRCDCRLGVGAACSVGLREIRTVQFPTVDAVQVRQQTGIGQDSAFGFDHVSGGIVSIPTDDFSEPLAEYRIVAALDTGPALRTTVGPSGRTTVCVHAGSVPGFAAC
jgi:type IV fimbrial biogenesis protein FimT